MGASSHIVDNTSVRQILSSILQRLQGNSTPVKRTATNAKDEVVDLQQSNTNVDNVQGSTLVEKTTISVDANSVCSSERRGEHSNAQHNERLSDVWRPSILRYGPLSGLAALLIALLQLLAAFAVLKASDGQAVNSWRYQPTVYLAILTAIGNKALAFAIVKGTITTFWLRAVKGTTAGQLHRDWAYGLHVYRAMMAGKHFNFLALACILTTLVVMDGPFLQRASSVRPKVPLTTVPLQVSITPEIPSYFTGASMYTDLPKIYLSEFSGEFIPILNAWTAGEAITGAVSGCLGKCEAKVRAPALAMTHCETEKHWKNYTVKPPHQEELLAKDMCIGPSDKYVIFKMDFFGYNGTDETIRFRTMWSDDEVAKSCIGYLTIESCWYVSAIAEYGVVISDGAISFPEPPSNPNIVAKANNTAITEETIKKHDLSLPENGVKTTLSGIASIGNIKYWVTSSLAPVSVGGNVTTPLLIPGQNWMIWRNTRDRAEFGSSAPLMCAPQWHNPRDEAMASMNELMFRTGVETARHHDKEWLESRLDAGVEINSTVQGIPRSPINVFHSDFNYFAAAAVVELICISSILFTFYGFWRLGRNVTFSPLEIAKAFDAPLFADASSHLNGYQIARLDGSRKVQFGVLNDTMEVDHESGDLIEKLVFADQSRVHRPGVCRRRSSIHMERSD